MDGRDSGIRNTLVAFFGVDVIAKAVGLEIALGMATLV